jgi:hypothetical protein
VNAPIRITPERLRQGDRQFLRQLKTANRQQLRAMLAVFERLAPAGAEQNAFCWKRAAVERKLGINRVSFGWLERDEWWNE